MKDATTTHRNPYSLLNCEYGNGQTYMIAVALDPAGKGGSRFMHEKVKAGWSSNLRSRERLCHLDVRETTHPHRRGDRHHSHLCATPRAPGAS